MKCAKTGETKAPTKLHRLAKSLDEFYLALGLTTAMLSQTRKALKKDPAALRVNALAFRGGMDGLRRMQRKLLVQFEQAGVCHPSQGR
jgi:hypothetical protein